MMKKKGFTLMETVVALSIAAVALSFFVAAYAPASIGIQRANSKEEAKLLASAVEAELKTIRPTFETALEKLGPSYTGTSDAFEKAFLMVSRSAKDANGFPTGVGVLLAHKYRANSGADPSVTTTIVDGIYASLTDPSKTDALSVASSVMDMGLAVATDTASDTAPMDAIEGACFAVALTQLAKDPTSGALIPDLNPVAGQLVDSSGARQSYANFNESVILIQADFYLMESNAPGYLSAVANGGQELPRKPIYTTRFGINR